MKARSPVALPRTRLAEARRNAGLTQKALATRAGIPLWTVAQIEKGAVDVTPRQLSALAEATGASSEWLRAPVAAGEADSPDHDATPARAGAPSAQGVVLFAIAALVLVRFFTEVVPVAPRALNFIDVPIFLLFTLLALTRRRERIYPSAMYVPFAPYVIAFLCVVAVSVVVNISRVSLFPMLVFVYGFLAPIAIYAAVYRIWPPGRPHVVSRLIIALGITQLVVVFAIQLPQFLSTENPDLISGTFGTNAYQLVFFLLIFTGLLAGVFTFNGSSLIGRTAPLLFIIVLAVIFLAQYRALLITAAVTFVALTFMLSSRGRGLVAAVLVATAFAVALSYVARNFPGLKFSQTVATLISDPGYYLSERMAASGRVLAVYSDEPHVILTGTGPGTFSSRAWQTFAQSMSESRSNVQRDYALALTGGRVYRTDVSDKYVLQPGVGEIVDGSRSLTSPFTSLLSLLCEVGVIGFAIVAMIYVVAVVRSVGITLQAARLDSLAADVPVVLVACAAAFIALLQMAFLSGNWLEVTRVTFISWALLAVGTKEFDAQARHT